MVFRIVLLCFVAFSQTSAQSIVESSKLYFYNNHAYDFDQLHVILKSNEKAYESFLSTQKIDKAASTLGKFTVGAMIVGTIAPIIDGDPGHCEFICVSTGGFIGIVSWFLAVPNLGVAAILTKIAANRRKKTTIDIFNNSLGSSYFDTSPTWNLSVESTSNGIGLVLNF